MFSKLSPRPDHYHTDAAIYNILRENSLRANYRKGVLSSTPTNHGEFQPKLTGRFNSTFGTSFNRNFGGSKMSSLQENANQRKLYTGHFGKRSQSNSKEQEFDLTIEQTLNITIPEK
jgi:hypothetical protein